MARTKFSELRDQVAVKPGATERVALLRAGTLEEIRLYELRHGEAISQAALAGRRASAVVAPSHLFTTATSTR